MHAVQLLRKIRSNLVFVFGLSIAAILAYSVENRGFIGPLFFNSPSLIEISPLQTRVVQPEPLSEEDLNIGIIAWQYFVKNTQSKTGLVNAVDGFPSTTLWDQASYLLGLISAFRLGLVDQTEFDDRMSAVLQSISSFSMFEGKLPNKVYNTINLSKTNYENEIVTQGIGWSALDISRMVIPLEIVIRTFPTHSTKAAEILSLWSLDELVSNGNLQGARINQDTGKIEFVQEGRLGYEEYGGRAAAILALDSFLAVRYDKNIEFTNIYDVEIASDRRQLQNFGANNYVVSEPYILTAIEFGFDRHSAELAHRILKVQQHRFLETNTLTAVSEDHVDEEPFFLYNTILVNSEAWVAVSESGEKYNHLKSLSTKAAFAWDLIYSTEYTKLLRKAALRTASNDVGWYSGIYELDGRLNKTATANTNGIILEALHFKAFGPLFHFK